MLVGVSGGVDSVVLLHLLLNLPPALRPRPVAAHYDHNLRGRASEADARFVKAFSRSLGVACEAAKAPRWRVRENVEAKAREMRYRFLVKRAEKLRIRKIVTAHHADDQLETFVMRWLQGAGLRGLSGIRPRRVLERRIELIRPLLDVTREEIVSYARAFRLPYREDATNRSGAFLRNRLRKLLRTLRKENPNLAERTAVNSLFLQADEDFLQSEVSLIFRKLGRRSSRKVIFPLLKYHLMPDALRYRLLQALAQALFSASHALPASAVVKVDEILRDSRTPAAYDLPSGLKLEKGRKHFVFFRKSR